MEKIGYIKLYRKSEEDELYFSDPFTKWQAWCDLLQLALFRDKVFFVRSIRINGKRGCVYMSRRTMAKRWQWSKGKVDRFIEYLVDVQKIEPLYDAKMDPRTDPQTNPQTDPQNTNAIGCITICNYDKYQSQEFTQDDQIDPQTNPPIDPQTNPQTDPRTDPYKKNIKNIYNISTSSRARAREEKNEESSSINPEEQKFMLSMKHSKVWLEAICMKFHLSRSDIIKMIDKFSLDQVCRDHTHEDLSDAKRHFNDWLNIQINIKEKAKDNEQQRKKPTDKRRGYEADVLTPQDYHSAF